MKDKLSSDDKKSIEEKLKDLREALSGDDIELVSRALAVAVRKSFVGEQMRVGLGIAFKGPLAAIDSKQQLKEYNAITQQIENSIESKAELDKISISAGAVIDIYEENVVTD